MRMSDKCVELNLSLFVENVKLIQEIEGGMLCICDEILTQQNYGASNNFFFFFLGNYQTLSSLVCFNERSHFFSS